ncbi:hypothetical protein CPB86DRAFT_789718, partial [Serendipita vermifera]
MPLQFPTTLSEINLISVLSILNFAHTYRVPLKKATGRGAYDSIRALMFGLYLSSDDDSDLLSAKGLKELSSARIAELMQLTNHIHVEKSHPTIPGLTIGELGGPLYEMVSAITNVLNETGSILVTGGHASLGEFVLASLKKGKLDDEENGRVDPEVVLDELIRTFPAFQDVGVFNGKPVYVFKKALFLLHALVLRFGSEGKRVIPLPDTSDLPIFSDNVIPSMLVHFGILNLSATTVPSLRTAFPNPTVTQNLAYVPSATNRVDGETPSKADSTPGPELSEEAAYVLRAAAIDACEMIVRRARGLNKDNSGSG